LKKLFLLSILFSLSHSFTFGQQRIGIDITAKPQSVNLTVHYQKIIKKNVLFSIGVFGGSNGKKYIDNDTLLLNFGKKIASPFSNANRTLTDTLTSFDLLNYSLRSKSIGIQFGIGYFYEFGVKHGIRANLNLKVSFAESQMRAFYWSIEKRIGIFEDYTQNYFIAAVSPELYHTIRVSGRITLNYGIKVPYFFSLDKSIFNPVDKRDLLYRFEPEFNIGITRVIGKCE